MNQHLYGEKNSFSIKIDFIHSCDSMNIFDMEHDMVASILQFAVFLFSLSLDHLFTPINVTLFPHAGNLSHTHKRIVAVLHILIEID